MKKNVLLGIVLTATVGLNAQNVGIGTATPIAKLHVEGGRMEVTATTDATGTTGSGVIEVGNSLRIDGNEIITNTATTLYLQNDNNGDLRVDNNTLMVDASADVIGFSGAPAPPYSLGAGIPVHTIAYPIEIGSDGNLGQQVTLGYYRNSDPQVNPEQSGGWGYVGYRVGATDDAWWRGYSYGWTVVSERSQKNGIRPINEDDALEAYVMQNIASLKPSFYNYNNELQVMKPGMENHYRPAFRLGLITDESPDYLLDEGFTGMDIYAVAALGLVGVKHNLKAIERLEQSTKVQDFGSQNLTTTELWVNFEENFNGITPVVTVSSNNPAVLLSITEKTDKGFKVVASQSASDLSFDWIAMAKVNNTDTEMPILDPNLKDKLEVPVETKSKIIDFYDNFKSTISPIK